MKFLKLVLCLSIFLSTAGRARAATITVNAGGDLQAAINAAQPGDTIQLQAGAVFTGPYTLPVKAGAAFITIRSATPDASLPASGVRITPAYRGSLAKVRATTTGPAFRTSGAASYWRLMFLEVFSSASTSGGNLIELGSGSQTTLSAAPQHVVVDRCYIHGDPSFAQRRGIALNSGDTQIV